MNYFALGGSILSAVLALFLLLCVITTVIGRRKWKDPFWGPILNAVLIAGFGTAAVAFYRMAVSA